MPSPVNPVSSSSQNGRAKRFGAKKWRHSPGLKGLIKTPRVQALSRHFTRSSRPKRIIFLPPIFLPTLTALDRNDPSSPFSTPPTTRIRANLWERRASCPSAFQSFTPSPVTTRIVIKSERKGKKISGKKMETGFKGRIRTPRFQTLSCHFTRSPRSKKSSFCPKSFCPPALPGPRRSLVAAFQRPPRPESVPICESTANLWPSVFQSFTPSPVNACIGIKSGQRNGDKGIGFSCPHSPAVPPPRGNDRVGIG
jgi:hypothetical protein